VDFPLNLIFITSFISLHGTNLPKLELGWLVLLFVSEGQVQFFAISRLS